MGFQILWSSMAALIGKLYEEWTSQVGIPDVSFHSPPLLQQSEFT